MVSKNSKVSFAEILLYYISVKARAGLYNSVIFEIVEL